MMDTNDNGPEEPVEHSQWLARMRKQKQRVRERGDRRQKVEEVERKMEGTLSGKNSPLARKLKAMTNIA